MTDKTNIQYDQSKDNRFQASINLGKDVNIVEEIIVEPADEFLTYDDVDDAFYGVIDEKYPESVFPNVKISWIKVHSADNDEWCPVFRESDEAGISECEKSGSASKFLVLPERTYSLTPECRLWMHLKEYGVLPEDALFDFDGLHKTIESIKGSSLDV